MDEFTEIEEPAGCLENIKDSIAKVGGGIVMILIAFPLLFWNEGRAVKRARDLETGQGAVVSVDASKVDSSHDGGLIHVKGKLSVDKPANDPQFGVTADAVVLRRQVEMYQWKENKKTKKKKVGGKKKKVTTYTYTKEWSSRAINSTNFRKPKGHHNPSMPVKGETFYANKASLGAYTLSRDLQKKWPADDAFKLDKKALEGFGPVNGLQPHLDGNQVYYGQPSKPLVGDVRISYKAGKPGKATVVAGLEGDTLVKWTNEDLNGSIGMVSPGTKSAKQMFKEAAEANAAMTWILRLVGFLLLFFGFNLLTGPIDAVADVIPIAGTLVDLGTTVLSGILAVALTAITIAIGWVFYRPLIGILLLVVGFGVIGAGVWLAMRARKAA